MVKKGQINIGYKGRRIAFNGQEKLVGQADRYSTIPYAAIVAYAAKAAAVPESSIEMSMEALYDALNYFVLNGHSVQIPYLGTFSLSVRAKSSESEAEFTNNFAQNLRGVRLNFLPDSDLKAMIASTAISTAVVDEEFDGVGVIAVTSSAFGAANTLFAINAGRPVQLEALTRIVLNGTRLSAKYLSMTAVHLTFIKADGTEESSVFSGQYISQTYNSLVINMKRIKENFPQYEALKEIKVNVGDDVYFDKIFTAPVEDKPEISSININGKAVAENATVPFEAGKAVSIKLLVANATFVDEIKIAGVAVQPSSVGEGYINLSYTPQASGNAPISVKSASTEASVYNVSFGQSGAISISSITANGDPLQNGSTTNIVAGSTYTIVILGSGLDQLTAEDFALPAGTTLSIGSQSASLINATLANAQSGNITITHDDLQLFNGALVAVTPTCAVTGYKTSASGATNALNVTVNANQDTGAFDIYLVGTELDELAQNEFSGTGITISSWDAESGHLTGVVDAGTRTLIISNEGTTIANISINKPSSGGDGEGDGLDKD